MLYVIYTNIRELIHLTFCGLYLTSAERNQRQRRLKQNDQLTVDFPYRSHFPQQEETEKGFEFSNKKK